jgi:hypothetical protein
MSSAGDAKGSVADRTNLSPEVEEVFERFRANEFLTLERDGTPITWLVVAFWRPEEGRFVLTTSIVCRRRRSTPGATRAYRCSSATHGERSGEPRRCWCRATRSRRTRSGRAPTTCESIGAGSSTSNRLVLHAALHPCPAQAHPHLAGRRFHESTPEGGPCRLRQRRTSQRSEPPCLTSRTRMGTPTASAAGRGGIPPPACSGSTSLRGKPSGPTPAFPTTTKTKCCGTRRSSCSGAAWKERWVSGLPAGEVRRGLGASGHGACIDRRAQGVVSIPEEARHGSSAHPLRRDRSGQGRCAAFATEGGPDERRERRKQNEGMEGEADVHSRRHSRNIGQ